MRYDRLSLPLLLAVLVVMIAGCGGGKDNSTSSTLPGKVQGQVQITLNHVLKNAVGANVRIVNTKLSAVTDANGNFQLSPVPPGNYTLLANMPASSTTPASNTVALSFTMKSGQTITITKSQLPLIPCTRQWTVLVYMNADNTLSPYSDENLGQMESVTKTQSLADDGNAAVSTVVERSIPASSTSYTPVTDRLLVVKNGSVELESTSMMGNVDMGKWQSLNDFINWGMQDFPAQHYLLVLWDHGSGALPMQTGLITRGISLTGPDTSTDMITTPQLASALNTALPVDVVAMDACLMQMAEVDYQIRNECSYIVDGEDSMPGDGYPYQLWLNTLVTNPTLTPESLARTIADQTISNYAGTYSWITQSVVQTSKLGAVATALDQFSAQLSAQQTNSPQPAAFWTSLGNQAEQFPYGDSLTSQPYYYRDLANYAALVKAQFPDNTSLGAAADALVSAVNAAVIDNKDGIAHQNACGLSIFLPPSSVYQAGQFASYYQQFSLSQAAPNWSGWLSKQ